jgi:hypothetical protein
MLPHISANEELQMPGLWRKEPWAELSYETVDAYRVGPKAFSRCTAGSCSPPQGRQLCTYRWQQK